VDGLNVKKMNINRHLCTTSAQYSHGY